MTKNKQMLCFELRWHYLGCVHFVINRIKLKVKFCVFFNLWILNRLIQIKVKKEKIHSNHFSQTDTD